jgi:hypothetical protein
VERTGLRACERSDAGSVANLRKHRFIVFDGSVFESNEAAGSGGL